jgi:prepilin-type N-terminal cleavage/methylation domain-containing protein
MRRFARAHPCRRAGFTLIELLFVVGILTILSLIAVGVGHALASKARSGQASAELAALSSALESYKQAFGDYPRTGSNAELLQALIGKRGPTGAVISGHAFLDTTHLLLSADPFADATAQCLDPWEQPYHFAYRTDSPWTHLGFVLYSSGPDMLSAPLLAGGEVNDSAATNRDDIFLER